MKKRKTKRESPRKPYEDLATTVEESVETDCKDPNAFAIIIEGDRMEPEIRAGDRVVFAPSLEPRNGDIVVAKLADLPENGTAVGDVYFARFERTGNEGKCVRLYYDNQRYNEVEFSARKFAFIYPAWEVKRKLRK